MKNKKPTKKLVLTDFTDLKDELFGPIGTPERDQYEKELKAEIKEQQKVTNQ